MKLSIVIPVYNEKDTFLSLLDRVRQTPFDKEIILVEDCSTDGTRDILKKLAEEDTSLKCVFHEKNMGKGAALATGFKHVEGDIVIIQDADLEYDPAEYPVILAPILDGRADVVYGSRFSAVLSGCTFSGIMLETSCLRLFQTFLPILT